MKKVVLVLVALLSGHFAHAESVTLISCYGDNSSAKFIASEITGLEFETSGLDSTRVFETQMPAFTTADFGGRSYVDLPAKSTLDALASGMLMHAQDGSDAEVEVTLRGRQLEVRGSQNLKMDCERTVY